MPPKVTQIIDAPSLSRSVKSTNTGAAPKIRKMKLRYPELSEAQIAKRVGCHPTNVHRVLKQFLGKNSNEEQLKDYQESKADVYDALQMRYLKSITDAKINKTSVVALTTGAAILEDKARNIRGQATQINVTVLLDAVQAIKDMRSRE